MSIFANNIDISDIDFNSTSLSKVVFDGLVIWEKLSKWSLASTSQYSTPADEYISPPGIGSAYIAYSIKGSKEVCTQNIDIGSVQRIPFTKGDDSTSRTVMSCADGSTVAMSFRNVNDHDNAGELVILGNNHYDTGPKHVVFDVLGNTKYPNGRLTLNHMSSNGDVVVFTEVDVPHNTETMSVVQRNWKGNWKIILNVHRDPSVREAFFNVTTDLSTKYVSYAVRNRSVASGFCCPVYIRKIEDDPTLMVNPYTEVHIKNPKDSKGLYPVSVKAPLITKDRIIVSWIELNTDCMHSDVFDLSTYKYLYSLDKTFNLKKDVPSSTFMSDNDATFNIVYRTGPYYSHVFNIANCPAKGGAFCEQVLNAEGLAEYNVIGASVDNTNKLKIVGSSVNNASSEGKELEFTTVEFHRS